MNKHVELVRLGETFRQVREAQRLSVAELATRTGVEIQRIRELEAGWFDPEFNVLIALADGMGVRASELVPKD
jgi:transcriptional regulator with XRE-family HTH domain